MDFLAKILGFIMEGIYLFLAKISTLFGGPDVGNIGIAIILFTLIIYVAMLPLTYRQQKFTKLQAKMQPEIRAIQEKYKGKKDTESQMAMNAEVQGVYAKYGVSMSGSCVQMILQMLILFPLYRVIYNMPMYVRSVGNIFSDVASKIVSTATPDQIATLKGLTGGAAFASKIGDSFDPSTGTEVVTQILNKCSSADWETLVKTFPSIDITSTHNKVETMNSFLGLNIGDSPSYMMSEALVNGVTAAAIIGIIAALIVPFLAAISQYLSVKLTTAMNQTGGRNADPNDPAASMQQSMKVMNVTMPIFSAWLCYTMPAGMGLYWISGAVIRTILAIIVNHRIDKIDIDAMIEANKEKAAAKMEKLRSRTPNMNNYAAFHNRNLNSINRQVSGLSEKDRQAAVDNAINLYDSGNARPDSLLHAANMVREYDRRQDEKKQR